MRANRGFLLLCTSLSLFLAGSAHAEIFEATVPPEKSEKYKSADFRLWVPDGVKQLRGVIVRQHGCGRNGITHAEDSQWQALAKKWNCALLGTHFQQDKQCSDWFDPVNGSERAFLHALKIFAQAGKHPELEEAPWALWGHSGGAMWSMHMTFRHPERVAAVFARSQAVAGDNKKALQVPIILNYGEQEKKGQFVKVHENSIAVFAKFRPEGALWSVAVDPKSSHDCRDSRLLAIPFFDAVLAQRLPAADAKPGAALKPLDAAKGWLGDPETFDIAAVADYKGDKSKASWLPDEHTARCWHEYCKTGTVTDKTPPPTPANLKAVLKDGKVQLTWTSEADVESGLKQFHIYRDGKKVASVGGVMTKANKLSYYQIWNYGDEPEPAPAAPPNFLDAAGDAASRYEVTAENHAGLESAKSAAATPGS